MATAMVTKAITDLQRRLKALNSGGDVPSSRDRYNALAKDRHHKVTSTSPQHEPAKEVAKAGEQVTAQQSKKAAEPRKLNTAASKKIKSISPPKATEGSLNKVGPNKASSKANPRRDQRPPHTTTATSENSPSTASPQKRKIEGSRSSSATNRRPDATKRVRGPHHSSPGRDRQRRRSPSPSRPSSRDDSRRTPATKHSRSSSSSSRKSSSSSTKHASRTPASRHHSSPSQKQSPKSIKSKSSVPKEYRHADRAAFKDFQLQVAQESLFMAIRPPALLCSRFTIVFLQVVSCVRSHLKDFQDLLTSRDEFKGVYVTAPELKCL